MTRNSSTDPNLPSSSSSRVALFTVSYSYTITTGYSVNAAGSTFALRTLTGTRGSSWSSFSASGNSFTPASVALPINLIGFVAKPTADFRTQLNWETATEHNTDHYDIERSTDGVLTFSKVITTVPASGNSNHKLNYQTYDLNPQIGNNYYRLKIVDNDGRIDYSEVRKVSFNGRNEDIAVYPTINRDGIIHIQLPEELDGTHFQVLNASGQLVPVSIDGKGLSRTMDLSRLPAGMYMLSVSYNDAIQSFKIKLPTIIQYRQDDKLFYCFQMLPKKVQYFPVLANRQKLKPFVNTAFARFFFGRASTLLPAAKIVYLYDYMLITRCVPEQWLSSSATCTTLQWTMPGKDSGGFCFGAVIL